MAFYIDIVKKQGCIWRMLVFFTNKDGDPKPLIKKNVARIDRTCRKNGLFTHRDFYTSVCLMSRGFPEVHSLSFTMILSRFIKGFYREI